MPWMFTDNAGRLSSLYPGMRGDFLFGEAHNTARRASPTIWGTLLCVCVWMWMWIGRNGRQHALLSVVLRDFFSITYSLKTLMATDLACYMF